MHEDLKKLISLSSWYIGLQLLTLVAFLGVTAVLYLDIQELKSGQSAAGTANNSTRTVSNWREYIRGHSPSQGPEASKVVIVEFSDFQCPYCKRFNDDARREVNAKYKNQVRWIFKHLPIDQIHANAKPAAIAAQCANREGKFWEIHDEFFRHPDRLSDADILAIGTSLGLGESFSTCVTQQESATEVKRDVDDAVSIGVQGTPALLINGRLIAGAQSAAQLEAVISKLLAAPTG